MRDPQNDPDCNTCGRNGCTSDHEEETEPEVDEEQERRDEYDELFAAGRLPGYKR